MKKVKIWIEEHLCREIEVEVPDDLDVEERMDAAEEWARQQYQDGEIVLDADDFNGQVVICVEDEETGCTTSWHDM